jgi:hypothetical protein
MSLIMDEHFIIEILGVIKWPLVVLLIAVILAGMFRGAMTRFLDRGTRLKAGSVAFDATAPVAEQSQQIDASKENKSPALPAPPSKTGLQTLRSPDRVPLYDPFDADVRKLLDDTFGDRNELKLDWAIRLRSQVFVERTHETNYRIIFTSQIFVLKRLNELRQSPLSNVRAIFDQMAEQNPNFYKNVSWEGWLNFLRSSGYVEIGPEADPLVRITPLGKDFLVWMAARGVPEMKPF